MPKKVVKSKKEDLKKEFRKMLIESLIKDMKKKKVKECTSSCKPIKKEIKKKVSTKCIHGGDDFQSEPFVHHKGTKKVERSEINSKHRKAMFGGDNFAKDLQKAGQGLGLAMGHTFQSMSNLGKDLFCETDAVMNIGKELDLGYTKDCPFTKTKSWDYNKIKQ